MMESTLSLMMKFQVEKDKARVELLKKLVEDKMQKIFEALNIETSIEWNELGDGEHGDKEIR